MKVNVKLSLLLAFSLTVNLVYSQTGTITNISVQPHTDGSGMLDVNFDLSGEADSYNILMEVSFDAGNTYIPIPTTYLSGDMQSVSPGSRHVVWDGYGSFPDEFSAQTRIKIIATTDGGGNGEPGTGVTDIDGNFYPSVFIGNQEWMAENLKTTKYHNGTPIDYPGSDNTAWQNNTTGAYAWYNNDINSDEIFGGLYNWYAVNTGNLCPTGWKVPSDNDWKYLEGVVDSQFGINDPEWDKSDWRGYDVSLNLKSSSGWELEGNGLDEFGFSALPGGRRATNGNFSDLGARGFWWSNTDDEADNALRRIIRYNLNTSFRGTYDKEGGYAVRCIRIN